MKTFPGSSGIFRSRIVRKSVSGIIFFMKIRQFFLDNGLNVFLTPKKEASSVAIELAVRAGSKNENKGEEGLAHFLEHMAFKGTQRWPTAQKLAEVLDNIGAVYNASTSKELTRYWIKIQPGHWQLALEVLSQLLNHPLLSQEEIEVERGVIIEEMHMYEDKPMDKVDDLFEEQILGKNPLGKPVIGKKSTIEKLSRKDFVRFRQRWYKGGRMSLAIVGAIRGGGKIQEQIKRLFGETPAGKAIDPKINPKPSSSKIHYSHQDTQQTHFVLGIPTVGREDEKKWAGKVLAAVLGRGFSSRLWRKIREERGWAYYIYAFQTEYTLAGFLAVKAGVKNQKAKEAFSLVKGELEKIKKDLAKEEVERAKTMLKGRFLIAIEDPAEVASLLNEKWLLEEKVITPKQVVESVEEVEWVDVLDFANQFLDLENLRGAVIGPKL